MLTAQEGDTVTILCRGASYNNEQANLTGGDETASFVLGNHEILPGLERAVTGMAVGERKIVTVHPEEAYGIRYAHLVEEVSLDVLPDDLELSEGNHLETEAADGTRYKMTILQRRPNSVVLDANHPLAGETLTFQVELLTLDRPTLN